MATLFRPSDVTVGPDGAIYVTDWIDARVGGHQDLDDGTNGAIYRIAPKGFVSKAPAFDAKTIDGLITALRSPAVNVRAIGFEGLKARGAAAVGPVAKLLDDPNRFIRGRALYLLYQLGPEGQKRAGTPESQKDAAMRIAAYRAMRRAGLDVLPTAARLAKDTDAGVRREVALSLRDVPAEKSLAILVDLARGYDGKDRSYLEALGHRRHRQGGGALRSPAKRSRRDQRSARLDAGLQPSGLASARACGRARPADAREVVEALGRRIASWRSTRSRSSTIRRRRRRCSPWASPTARCASRRRGGC